MTCSSMSMQTSVALIPALCRIVPSLWNIFDISTAKGMPLPCCASPGGISQLWIHGGQLADIAHSGE